MPFKETFQITNSERELQIGDQLLLGRRLWTYVGKTDIVGLQVESVWRHENHAESVVDKERVMAWSEVDALIKAGMVTRTMPVTISLASAAVERLGGGR